MCDLMTLNGLLKAINDQHLIGGEILNYLHKHSQNCRKELEKPLEKMFEKTCVPFFAMLAEWIYNGTIQDPFEEFMIKVNSQYTLDDLKTDYNDKYPFLLFILNFPLTGIIVMFIGKVAFHSFWKI